jgi:hypothetical protein
VIAVAKVFRNATRAVALSVEVQAGLQAAAEAVAARATAYAHGHDDSGEYAASIHVERGRVDRYVVAGDPDALHKEFGRTGGTGGSRSRGVFALTRALGEHR